MPYNPLPRTFTNAAGLPVTRIPLALDPPVAPATEAPGEPVVLFDRVRRAGERYCAAQVGGPSDRTRSEISIDGAPWQTLDAEGVAAGAVTGELQEVRLRGVHLDREAEGTEVCLWRVWVAGDGGEADWDVDVITLQMGPYDFWIVMQFV